MGKRGAGPGVAAGVRAITSGARGPLGTLLGHVLFGRGSERSQAITRLLITGAGALYLCAVVARGPTEPGVIYGLWLVLGFLAFGLVLYLTIRLWPRPSIPRRVVGILADQAAISYAMHLTGAVGAVFYPLYLWVSVGNGLRFGPRYMALATAAGLAGFAFTATRSAYWQAQGAPLVTGLLFGILILPVFFWTLLRELHEANRNLRGWLRTQQAATGRDVLTGLADRRRFLGELREAVACARAGEGRLLLALVDLDGLGRVNDSLGHEAGDALLRQAAQRLRGGAGPKDRLGRIDGDEFALLRAAGPGEDAETLARTLATRFEAPFRLKGHAVTVGARVGIAELPGHAEDAEGLLRAAQQALYRARTGNGVAHRVHGPGMSRCSAETLLTESALRRALHAGELRLHYQPRIELATGRIVAAEALLRWHRPGHGLLAPEAFLPLAERSDLVCQLGEWVLREIARLRRRLGTMMGRDGLVLAANLAPVHLGKPGLCERVEAALGVARRGWLELEITERVSLGPLEQVRAVLDRLRRAGVRVALDDFGTGFSSLAHLRELPVDTVKIDCRFIAGVDSDPRDRSLVAAVVRLAHDLGLRVVAEGVERATQLQALEALGCDEAQGFLFHPPLPADDFLALLAETRSAPDA